MVGSVRRGSATVGGGSAGRLVGVGALGGLLGGMAMALFMMIWMAATGAGFWTPLNVGMASLSYRIVPPASVMPMLAKMMPAHPSSSVLPSLEPIMTVFPRGAFFVAHLIFGAVLGAAGVLAVRLAACTASAPAPSAVVATV